MFLPLLTLLSTVIYLVVPSWETYLFPFLLVVVFLHILLVLASTVFLRLLYTTTNTEDSILAYKLKVVLAAKQFNYIPVLVLLLLSSVLLSAVSLPLALGYLLITLTHIFQFKQFQRIHSHDSREHS